MFEAVAQDFYKSIVTNISTFLTRKTRERGSRFAFTLGGYGAVDKPLKKFSLITASY